MNGRPFGLAFLGFVCGSLYACSVAPTYRRPDIPAPAQWKESARVDGSGTDQGSASVWPQAEWWHAFGSEKLDDLIAEAQRSNDDIAGAIARIEEADAQARIAGAPLLPSLDFDATATRERAQFSGVPRLLNVFSPALSASYEIDFWGKNRALRDAARALAAASRYDRQTVALTVISSVATTYFQALELRDRIQVAQQNLDNGQQILKGFKLEESAGVATGLDVALQETTVATLSAAIPPLLQQFRQTSYSLAVLVGRTPEALEVDTGTLTGLSAPIIVEGLPAQLLSRRPDVAQAEQQLIAANADIGAARAALFPDIVLTASGGYASPALASVLSPHQRVYALTAGLTQPIFRGGALRGQLANTRARYTELLTVYHKTVLTAFSNVEGALVAAQQTAEQQKRQQDAVVTARRAYEFAQKQMSAGTVNVLNVLNTENSLFSAQDQLVQVNYLHLQALVNLFIALGGGWHQG